MRSKPLILVQGLSHESPALWEEVAMFKALAKDVAIVRRGPQLHARLPQQNGLSA